MLGSTKHVFFLGGFAIGDVAYCCLLWPSTLDSKAHLLLARLEDFGSC